MKSIPTEKEDHHSLPHDLIPEGVHDALVRRLCNGAYATKTVRNAYLPPLLRALASIQRRLGALPEAPLEELLTESRYAWIVEDYRARCKLATVVSHLGNLKSSVACLCPEANWDFMAKAIANLRKECDATADSSAPKSAPKRIDPNRLSPAQRAILDRLKTARRANGRLLANEGRDYRGVVLHFLGVADQGGVDVASASLDDLVTPANVESFERSLIANGSRKSVTSQMNTLRCALKHLSPRRDVQVVFDRVAALRKLRAKEARGADDREPEGASTTSLIPWEEVPEEDRRRFQFAIKDHDPRQRFEFNGQSVDIPHQPLRPDMVAEGKLTLRRLHTLLKACAPHISRQAVDERDYQAVALLFWEGFAKRSKTERGGATEATSLERLLMVLRRIVPTVNLRFVNRWIRDINNATPAKVVEVPGIATAAIRATAFAIMAKAYRRFNDLSACPCPYRRREELAERFRNALAMAILSVYPIRLRTLSLLLDVDTIVKTAAGYALSVPGKFMKDKKDYYADLPAEFTVWINRYRDEVRQAIAPWSKSKCFWLSREGEGLSRPAFQSAIPKLVLEHFGIWVNVHLFRHLKATERGADGSGARVLRNSKVIAKKHYVDRRKAPKVVRATSLPSLGGNILVGRKR